MALTKISGNVVQQNNFSLSGVVTATSFTGDLTGNVTGNVTGTATTATNLADGANITTGTISNDRLPATITKNLTGDVTGNLTGNVTGTATTATNLSDGANITTGTISNDRLPSTITKNLTGDVTGNLTGNVSSSGANTLGSLTVTNDATVGGALTVTGNLTVNGTTTTIDTVVTAIDSLAVDGDVTAGGNLDITGVSTFKGTTEVKNASFKVTNSSASGQYLQVTQNSNSSLNLDKVGDGAFYIRGNNIYLQNDGTSETYAGFEANGKSYLNYDGSTKLETTGTGVTITGDARVTGILTVGQSSVTIDGTNNKITTPKLDYAGISSSISDTAVDVFVYDTRKDSDGGAWRKRTQHTSWYNETLNTATRGSRREFPAVVVLVLEQLKLTIYDGDDPDLPMWMIFNQTGTKTNGNCTMLGANGDNHFAISALNGIIAVGENESYGGLVEIMFARDTARRRRGAVGNNGTNGYWTSKYISTRNTGNTGLGRGYDDNNTDTANIVTDNVNDVAMTVLPNAPIDDATGLPIPTIAVATPGGVSVIKDDGNVYDIDANSSTYQGINKIHFTPDNKLAFSAQQSGSHTGYYRYIIANIPNSDTVAGYWQSFSDELIDYAYSTYAGIPALFTNSGVSGNINAVSKSNSDKDNAIGGDQSLTLLSRSESQSTDMVAYATTSYNTGWMHGDIKGAFLSDTDATNAVGTELHPNGNSDFSSTDVSYISNTASGTATVTSGQLVLSGGTAGYSDHVITVNTEVDAKYIITVDYVAKSGGGSIGMYVNNSYINEANAGNGYVARSTGNTYTFYFTADATTENIDLVTGGSGSDTHTFDNWSIKKVEEDRSVNNKGLQVFETITKSAVATGAELVAYSGFSASNYLIQPYNSDLDFGTGDLSIIFWYKTSSGSSQCILHRGDAADSGGGWGSGPIIQIEFNGTNLAAFLSNSGFSGYDTVGIPIATSANGVWNHYALTRSGGTMNVYFNGSLYGSASSTRTLTNTSARTWIGERPNSTRPATNTSLALFRMGASAPSAEQVKKMYEDEKVLFQENAACTLYGSSDAVTALAYDEVTEQLHVGTSSGRSDFQGLRRINNTTTAVTTAISAHDEFIVEQ